MSFEIAVKKAEGVERLLGVTVSVETVKAAEEKAVEALCLSRPDAGLPARARPPST